MNFARKDTIHLCDTQWLTGRHLSLSHGTEEKINRKELKKENPYSWNPKKKQFRRYM